MCHCDIRQYIERSEHGYRNVYKCIAYLTKGQNIILKCDVKDIFINACNRDILALWQGNIDLQCVVDEYSTVMYVCSYLNKGEKALGETLKRVANECRNDDLWTQMKKIKKEFLGEKSAWSSRISYVCTVHLADEKK